MIFRCYHETKGAHVHCRFFSGPHEGALGKNGDLCFRASEFAVFQKAAPFMQFRRDQIPSDWQTIADHRRGDNQQKERGYAE